MAAMAYFGGRLATDLVQTADLLAESELLDHGWWAVCATFEGAVTGYRFATVRPAPLPLPLPPPLSPSTGCWPAPGDWQSSLDRAAYVAGVSDIRARIEAGDVYQVNLCRLLSAVIGPDADPLSLAAALARGNPARYAGVLHTGTEWLVSASPELFLARTGDELTSAPVKGTARLGEAFAAKDYPENVMITDLVRHDLGRVAAVGSVVVRDLLRAQDHPGLRHLVSVISARLRPELGWADLFAALLPPGSVSGAPKHTALQAIRQLEPVPRGVYCGAVGWIDGDRRTAELAVGIRTFFTSGGRTRLHLGTGAGITHASDPLAEWQETELKAARLLAVAAGAGDSIGAAGVGSGGG